MHLPVRNLLVLVVSVAIAAAAAFAQGKGPGDAYEEIAAAVKQATSVEAILPLLGASFRKDVEAQDAEGRKAFFAYFKSSLDRTDLAITSEKIEGDGAVVEATGKAGGKESTGRIEMVREGGAWKLQDFGWATPN